MFGLNNCGASVPVVADIGCNGNNGGFGGNALEDIIALVVVAAIFGFGGRGFGFGGFGGASGGGCCEGNYATSAEVQRGFDNQATQSRFSGLENAFAQSGYASQQHAFDIIQAINTASTAAQQCCCDTQRAIDGVNYNMSQGFANLGSTIAQSFAQASFQQQQCCCDLQTAIANSTNTVLNQLNAYRMEDKNETIAQLRSDLQNARMDASQANQNAVNQAARDAQTAEILRRTGHDCPTAAYVVQPPTPVTFPNYCGCGCGNGYAYAA